jgi:hypothetical protein
MPLNPTNTTPFRRFICPENCRMGEGSSDRDNGPPRARTAHTPIVSERRGGPPQRESLRVSSRMLECVSHPSYQYLLFQPCCCGWAGGWPGCVKRVIGGLHGVPCVTRSAHGVPWISSGISWCAFANTRYHLYTLTPCS